MVLATVVGAQCALLSSRRMPPVAATGLRGLSRSAPGFSVALPPCILRPRRAQEQRKLQAPRASPKSDVPAFKGFPPMQDKPAWYWRILACLPYLMPLCESWMYAETAYNLHCFIEQFEFWTYPFLNLLGQLPSWFLLAYFFVAYLGIVRKNIWPHFFRFHVVTGMLLEIILQVFGTLNDWIPQSIYWGKIGAHFWLAAFFTYFLTVLESIRCALRGMYADIPFISDAAYMQIPYDS